MAFVLDTHALVWYLSGSRQISGSTRKTLDATTEELLIPALTLAESSRIIDRRTNTRANFNELIGAIDNDSRLRVVAMDREVVETAIKLDKVDDLHDRLIVATAVLLDRRGMDITLVTRDEVISNSGYVRVLW